MKAIQFCEYGPSDVLKLAEIEKPVPNDNQLLVKVRAASLNAIDTMVRGPLLVRSSSDCDLMAEGKLTPVVERPIR